MSSRFKWQGIIGHEQTVGMLRSMLGSGNIQHAMLFVGPEGVGKTTVAGTAAAAILCDQSGQGEACGVCPSCQALLRGAHPDLYSLAPEGTSIKIDQIRVMQREMAMSPCRSRYRVCLITTAELMTEQAANSLLKVLEEPPAYLVFILTANQRYRLLDTVVSRCRLFPFQPVPVPLLVSMLKDGGIAEDTAIAAARLSGGRFGAAKALAGPEGLAFRDRAAAVLASVSDVSPRGLLEAAAPFAEKEDKGAGQLLAHLGILLRDLAVVKAGHSQQLVFNIDKIDQLTTLAQDWCEAALAEAYAAVRRAERALAGNANARLTAEALVIELNELYKGGKQCIR